MARRRKSRSRSRRYYRPKRRRSRSKSSGMNNFLAAAVYGGARGYLSNMVAPVTAKIPMGNYADNVAMIGLNYVAKRFIPIPMVKQAAKTGLLIEAAMVGAELVQNNFSMGTVSNNAVLW
jgi:hypothetical protein